MNELQAHNYEIGTKFYQHVNIAKEQNNPVFITIQIHTYSVKMLTN